MGDLDISILNNTNYPDMESFVLFLMKFLIGLSIVVSVMSLLGAGFKFILSGGDDKKISEAGRALIFSIIGLVLVFLSPNIVKFIVDGLLK